MGWNRKIREVQEKIALAGWDGWLLYDFRKSNDLACRFLEIPEEALATRRFFYWIPKSGDPVKVAHRIEPHLLAHLPGTLHVYSTWNELDQALAKVLSGSKQICMEYSPRNAVPTVSKVDAGTMEAVVSLGVKVESSADILQQYTSVWTPRQFELHCQAAEVLQSGVERAWKWVAEAITYGRSITEYDAQTFLIQHFKDNGCHAEASPICAVNAHSADPHYAPEKEGSSPIRKGDFLLIDVWCKKDLPGSVYADITRVAVAAEKATDKQIRIFEAVKKGRDAALALLKERLDKGAPLRGWEVDRACRDAIIKEGYGEYFTHRTGHSIGEKDHGDGANIDDFETKEQRLLLPGTCFSIEPGIYLPGEFGVRLEDDVFIDPAGKTLHITNGKQETLACLLS